MKTSAFHFEYQMQSPAIRWLVNGLLVLVIYGAAELGRLFGLHMLGLQISVVWPPTGIALAALLLFGFRTWPGIFLGNYLYNFLHLSLVSSQLVTPLFAAIAISLGSTMEVMLAGYVIQRFSSPGLFHTVKDIAIFLVPGGLIPAMLASSIGVTALYLFGVVPVHNLLLTWLTFSIGDAGGLYVFAPLIVVWATQKPAVKIGKYLGETTIIVGMAAVLSLLTYWWSYPLMAYPFPLALWASYRYRMHGATLTILFICLIAVIPTSLGIGAVAKYVVSDQLIILVSFLEIIVVFALVSAALINEREAAWRLLQIHNIDLKEAVNLRSRELKVMYSEIFVKQKLASIGMITLGALKHIEASLQTIRRHLISCKTILNSLKHSFRAHQEEWNAEAAAALNKNLEKLDETLRAIGHEEESSQRLMELIQEHSLKTPEKIHSQSINLHTLINRCLDQVQEELKRRFPDFSLTVNKKFDSSVPMVSALPEDLAYALIHLFNHAAHSLIQKKQFIDHTASYTPTLSIRTVSYPQKIELVIHDNGEGIAEPSLEALFATFGDVAHPKEVVTFNSLIVEAIIVHIHNWDIKAHSKKGEFLEITLTIPQREPFIL